MAGRIEKRSASDSVMKFGAGGARGTRAGAAVLVAVAGACSSAAPALAADVHYRVVARSGQAAPGGGAFDAFSAPRITPDGRVAFRASLSAIGGPTGIWSEGMTGMQQLELVAFEGDAAPGPAGMGFAEFPAAMSMVLNAAGELAFAAKIDGPQTEYGEVGIFVHSAGGIDTIAAPGSFVQTGCGGMCQRWLAGVTGSLAFNDASQVAFAGTIDGTGINSSNASVICRADATGVDVLLQEGEPAPGMPGFELIDSFGSSPLMNNLGEVVASRYITTDGVEQRWSIWRGTPGTMDVLAYEGYPSPMNPLFMGNAVGTGNVSVNDANMVLFEQSVDTPGPGASQGLWLSHPTFLATACYEGQPAPNGLTYAMHDAGWGPEIGADGALMFRAKLAGAGVNLSNDTAMILEDADGAAHILVREGSQAPGMLAGVTFKHVGNMGSRLIGPTAAVVTGTLEGPGIHAGNDESLWLMDIGFGKTQLLREGQAMVVGGALRMVESFGWMQGNGEQAGAATGASALGQVACHVEFTDGSSAVIVASPGADLRCEGDVNGDFVVNSVDLNIMLAAFGHLGSVVQGDLDRDGDVDSNDLNEVLANFGDFCPQAM